MDPKPLSVEELAAALAERTEALTALIALEAPTDEQVTEAERLATEIDEINAETTARETAAAERSERLAALRERFTADQAEAEDGEEGEEGEGEPAEGEEAVVEAEEVGEPVAAAVKRGKGGVVTLARKTTRPPAPRNTSAPITITAAHDVPDFSAGQKIDMGEVTKALINRMRGFGTPSGDGESENLQHFGVAKLSMDFPEELTIDRGKDDMEVLAYAAKESRLPGNSLVASNGWCAPSETLYDLCTTETTEGILSIPEINVKRGGINFTQGPDFSTIYTNVGFQQTEAQAISGTTKTCFEVPCPSFTNVRLDAIGLCIKAPILTNSAYPELVRRWLDGSLIAHQHKVNASVIASIVTAAGAARVYGGLGTAAGDTLDALELVAESLREKYRMGLTQTMEVVLPNWVKGVIRADLAKRTGQEAQDAVTDQMIMAHFNVRHLAVSFVYDWNMLPTPDTVIVYPTTFQALMYPAGTFVKGTTDVINLNAVYDAASLATNIYTALFFEQGLLVAKLCNQAALVTIPNVTATGISGKTGANSL